MCAPIGGVPFVVGVTGHRDLRNEDIPVLRRLIRDQLAAWMDLCPNTEFYCMTSLAEGADQLCGRVASDLGIKLLVPLPMEQAEFEKDFSNAALIEFRDLVNEAASVFVAPDTERQDDGTRDYAYRKAGVYLARHCHVLLALWDGLAGESGCCGTAEAVDFKMKRAYRAPDTLLTAPDEGIVLQIVTPRVSGETPPDGALTSRLLENAEGALRELLNDTNAFNKDAGGLNLTKSCGVFDADTAEQLGPAAKPLDRTYRLADTLALRFRDKYLNMLKWLCATGALLVVSFLFYDELEANLFLISYGLIAAVALFIFFRTKHGRCHKKYIEYRLFAETLRVQLNLLASGLDVCAEDLMPWSQRTISPWIREAMNTLPHGGWPLPDAPADICAVWMSDQLSYQKKTVAKNTVRLKRQSMISGVLLAFTILFFIAVVALEFLFPAWIGRGLALPGWLVRLAPPHTDHFFSVRSVFKILLGIVPALTFVVSSYYGKLSLERKLRDGKRMVALYSEALEAFNNPLTDHERLLTELAREELIETGDWLSYVSENRPDILI